MKSLLLQFRQPVDDSDPHLVADLHLHHLGRETASNTQRILQLELHMAATAFDQMKEQQRSQALEFIVCSVLAQVEDLRHAISLSSANQ